MSKSLCIPLALSFVLLAGCAGSQIKARKDQREKASQASGMYCDFVNGEIYPDVEVQLNLEMAKRCDDDKNYSVTGYKTSNENMGILYCCSLKREVPKKAESASAKSATSSKAYHIPSAIAAPAPSTAPTAAPAAAAEAKKADVKSETKPDAKAANDDGLDE